MVLFSEFWRREKLKRERGKKRILNMSSIEKNLICSY